ncbi:UPF0193 protein EVG1 homolog [Belonocnema kinseyi]|uniref:UPF0193 protein EVG1 homolog n=1 Tax=Belonocnema kinseyi TaxID=2817044 RepID=UPI00143D22CF|nr:UPF0193 protein EVG1 homolog [Belonocnema kinseyi]
MERKTQRVGIGLGAFHNPPRAKYSEETRNLIKELMEESKLSMMQRKSIQNVVDRGEPLPLHKPSVNKKKANEPEVMYPSIWKKRSQDMMIASGAYEREQYRRTCPLVDMEKQKRHLAYMMAFGKDMPPTPTGPKILHQGRNRPRTPDEKEVFQELVEGIRERIEFLNDMEALGRGKKYRPIIQQEIAQKLRLIENRPTGLEKELAKLKNERPTPKPYPLGDLAI